MAKSNSPKSDAKSPTTKPIKSLQPLSSTSQTLYKEGIQFQKERKYTEAFEKFKAAVDIMNSQPRAKNPEVKAYYALAECYRKAQGTEKNEQSAFDNYKKAADCGVPEAYRLVVDKYSKGFLDHKPDYENAKKYADLASAVGDDVYDELGMDYATNVDDTEFNLDRAVTYFNQTDPKKISTTAASYTKLADMEGDSKSDKAKRFTKIASRLMNIATKLNQLRDNRTIPSLPPKKPEEKLSGPTATELFHEEGVQFHINKEYSNALKKYKQAIELLEAREKHPATVTEKSRAFEAYYNLAFLYELGQGVEKNEDKALEYFKKAAGHNVLEAFNKVGVRYYRKKEYENAKKYFEMAVEKKAMLSHALANLGILHAVDRNEVKKDVKKAIDYFQEAFKAGYTNELAKEYFGDASRDKEEKIAYEIFKRRDIPLGHLFRPEDAPALQANAKKYQNQNADLAFILTKLSSAVAEDQKINTPIDLKDESVTNLEKFMHLVTQDEKDSFNLKTLQKTYHVNEPFLLLAIALRDPTLSLAIAYSMNLNSFKEDIFSKLKTSFIDFQKLELGKNNQNANKEFEKLQEKVIALLKEAKEAKEEKVLDAKILSRPPAKVPATALKTDLRFKSGPATEVAGFPPLAPDEEFEKKPEEKISGPTTKELFKAGLSLYNAKKYDEAFKKYKEVIGRLESIESNPGTSPEKSPEFQAYYHFAYLYMEGEGVAKNEDLALIYFQKAVNHKISLASNNLGVLFYKRKDYLNAKKYFEMGDNKHTVFNLGLLYALGRGVEKDIGKAIAFFKRAEALGYPEQMAKEFFDQSTDKEEKAARKIYELRNASGVELFNEGIKYIEGQDQKGNKTTEDEKLGFDLTKLAADRDRYNPAYYNLSAMYIYGNGTPIDPEKSAFYLEQYTTESKEQQKHIDILFNAIGCKYYSLKKHIEASKYYKKAGAQNKYALVNLGILHTIGQGVDKDVKQALLYFKQAIQAGYTDEETKKFFENPNRDNEEKNAYEIFKRRNIPLGDLVRPEDSIELKAEADEYKQTGKKDLALLLSTLSSALAEDAKQDKALKEPTTHFEKFLQLITQDEASPFHFKKIQQSYRDIEPRIDEPFILLRIAFLKLRANDVWLMMRGISTSDFLTEVPAQLKKCFFEYQSSKTRDKEDQIELKYQEMLKTINDNFKKASKKLSLEEVEEKEKKPTLPLTPPAITLTEAIEVPISVRPTTPNIIPAAELPDYIAPEVLPLPPDAVIVTPQPSDAEPVIIERVEEEVLPPTYQDNFQELENDIVREMKDPKQANLLTFNKQFSSLYEEAKTNNEHENILKLGEIQDLLTKLDQAVKVKNRLLMQNIEKLEREISEEIKQPSKEVLTFYKKFGPLYQQAKNDNQYDAILKLGAIRGQLKNLENQITQVDQSQTVTDLKEHSLFSKPRKQGTQPKGTPKQLFPETPIVTTTTSSPDPDKQDNTTNLPSPPQSPTKPSGS